jgi:D-glycero-D-manno-heptose 1,7-bisphosphate phosphatase
MLEQAAELWDIELDKSFMVGDKPVDVKTGRKAGCRTILIRSEKDPGPGFGADLVAATWDEALKYILACDVS